MKKQTIPEKNPQLCKTKIYPPKKKIKGKKEMLSVHLFYIAASQVMHDTLPLYAAIRFYISLKSQNLNSNSKNSSLNIPL